VQLDEPLAADRSVAFSGWIDRGEIERGRGFGRPGRTHDNAAVRNMTQGCRAARWTHTAWRRAKGYTLENVQSQFRQQLGCLPMRDRGALEECCVGQAQSTKICLAKVCALKTGLLEMRVAQAATFKDGFAKVAPRQIGFGQIELNQSLFAERSPTQVDANHQAFREGQAEAQHFFKMGAGELASLQRGACQLGSVPLGVVEIAAVEAGVGEIRQIEIGLPCFAVPPLRSAAAGSTQIDFGEHAIDEPESAEIQAGKIGPLQIAAFNQRRL